MMEKTPKSLRLHIGIFGRANVGKSSFLNLVSGQAAAITSPVPGTTTDVVEKIMELLPIGPVVFLDTAGVNDASDLGEARVEKTLAAFGRTDMALLILEPNVWTDDEEKIRLQAIQKKIPIIAVINKCDLGLPGEKFLELLKTKGLGVIQVSSTDLARRELAVQQLKKEILSRCPDGFLQTPALAGDLVKPGSMVVMVVPIDLEAPKGRLILPQVQTIRDLLDRDSMALVVKEREYRHALESLKNPPDLVICDSQVVQKTAADTPAHVKLTTFSILFARFKGDLDEMVRGVRGIERLKSGDKVLIAEACSHHAAEDDIGRVKIPRWLKQYTGLNLSITVSSGFDFPPDLRDYRLVIHCGSCMLNRQAMLSRLQSAKEAGTAITNYGVCISYLQGVFPRVLMPFPSALETYRHASETVLEGVSP